VTVYSGPENIFLQINLLYLEYRCR